ncbi:MAG: GNAT family N-acetyltransferase [Hamadaea sp.]|nr:GNAT family N-acetyltransferase [Hamadaea sp.]
MGLSWEPLRADDAHAWAAHTAAVEAADLTGENYDADDLAEELEDTQIDLARGTLTARDGDVLAAVAVLRHSATASPEDRVYLDSSVHPAYRGRGLGAELIRWAVRTAAPLSAERFPGAPVELHASVHEANTGKAALFEQEGFTPRRWFFDMKRDLPADTVPPVVAAPDGVRIVGFDPAAHDAAALEVRNEAFADHWGSTMQTEQTWRQWFTGTRAFRPDLSYVAVAENADGTDEVVAILLSQYFAADTAVTGIQEMWISTIGTRRAWRKRGLASALIGAALTEAHRQGFDRAALGVDADSPTGALGVYQRAGFAVEFRTTRYVREL